MEKTLGKARFSELLSDLVEKPKGKPTLVLRVINDQLLIQLVDDFKEN